MMSKQLVEGSRLGVLAPSVDLSDKRFYLSRDMSGFGRDNG